MKRGGGCHGQVPVDAACLRGVVLISGKGPCVRSYKERARSHLLLFLFLLRGTSCIPI